MMGQVYFLSDLHLNHQGILKYRDQFQTIQAHNDYIVQQILKTIGQQDILWLLGDICYDRSALAYLNLIKQHCKQINLVLGNHDLACQDYQAVVASLDGFVKYQDCWLSHAPIHSEALMGRYNIHGHTHRHNIQDPRYFNVSCEAVNYQPVSFKTIKKRWQP